MLVGVLLYGTAMQSTGLARRLSLYVLSVFPGTYRGVLTAFMVIGFVLSLGVPSMTVRTAIMVPVAWALTDALALTPRSAGTAVIVLTSIEMAVLPGCAFLTGSLFGPIIESLFRSRGFELSWWAYMRVMAFPVVLLSALVVVINPLVVRPEVALRIAPTFARTGLEALGRVTRNELITAAVVTVSTAYWATGHLHQFPAVLIVVPALAVLVLSGILTRRDARRMPWKLLLFLGAVFGLVSAFDELGMAERVAGYLAPVVRPLSFSPLLMALFAAGTMFLARFVDPTGFVALTALFLPLADITREFGFPPMVLLASLLMAISPFWVAFQNIWIAIGEGVTGKQGFAAAHRIRLAHAYAVLACVTLAVSIVFWRVIGIL